MENFKRPNKLSMVTTLFDFCNCYLLSDYGSTSSPKKEAPKPVVVITGLRLFAVLYLEQLFYKVAIIIKKF